MPDSGIAIVGMSVLLPGAPDLATYWHNLVSGVDAIGDVPPDRWDPVFYDPDAKAQPDRFYCRRGGFVNDATFDATAFGIMPVSVEGAEPDQLLALRVATQAFDDVGPSSEHVDRTRVGVILGRGASLTAGLGRMSQRVQTPQQIVECLRVLVPEIDEATLDTIRTRFQEQLGVSRPEGVIGLVPNLAASRIANRLDLQGPAYTVDAACASSLLAVHRASEELSSGRCDLMLAGGVHHCHDLTFWSVFTQLGALSHTQCIRPFSRRADGLLIGEGTGVVALKRLEDAARDGDRIYAVVRGVGVASDGRGSLMTPRIEGQMLAFERAWRQAGFDPDTLGLLEAHGTATPAGDEAELETLARFFGPAGSGPRAVLGSVKSMIGHAMPAAGIAGLVKSALAVHHGMQLPTLHCEEPHPHVEKTRFCTLGEARPWESGGQPRRAGVNAFGFGGINAHVILEEDPTQPQARRSSRLVPASRRVGIAEAPDAQIWVFSAPDVSSLLGALNARAARSDSGSTVLGEGPVRLAIGGPTPKRVDMARRVVERGLPWRGRNDIWFTQQGLADAGGKVAFLFPGLEPRYDPHIEDVARWFDVPNPRAEVTDLTTHGFEIVEVSRCLNDVLLRVGIEADAIAGHSVGEWSGMITSELIPPADVDEFLRTLADRVVPSLDVAFVAIGAGVEVAEEVIEGLDHVVVSHDNCPHQSVICGSTAVIPTVAERLRARRVLSEELPFRSGFHTPFIADHISLYEQDAKRLPIQRPRTPLWSATTCSPFPEGEQEVSHLVRLHLLERVRFRELTRVLYAQGTRLFVQVGQGSLTGFVADTLSRDPHLSIAALTLQRDGMSQLRRAAAALFVEGVPVRLEELLPAGAVTASGSSFPGVKLADDAASPQGSAPRRPPVQLKLGTPLVRLDGKVPPLRVAPDRSSPIDTRDPLLAELDAVLREAGEAGREVTDLARATSSTRAVRTAGSRATRRDRSTDAPRARPRNGERSQESGDSRECVIRRRLSVENEPAYLDHCFFLQPEGATTRDLFPLVPMTGIMQLMIDAARELAPDRVVIAVEQLRAQRWVELGSPVDVDLRARFDGPDRIRINLTGFARGTLVLSDRYPEPPELSLEPLQEAYPVPFSVEEVYRERWMFHGPKYQGIVDIGPMDVSGVRGVLRVPEGPGALLDNASQIMALWLFARGVEVDAIALPTQIGRVEFFGPDLAPGTRVECEVRNLVCSDRAIRGDGWLIVDGRVWAHFEGWEQMRFDSDPLLLEMLRYPDRCLLAEPGDRPYTLVREHCRSARSRELLMRRYLGPDEQAEYEALTPLEQRGWLLRRMAAKDALRAALRELSPGPLFPMEIRLREDDEGYLHATGRGSENLALSTASAPDVAVAMVAEGARVELQIRYAEEAETEDVLGWETAKETVVGGEFIVSWKR